jgi:hypothetical protein
MKYKVVGSIQGTGMSADKFYNVAWDYKASDPEEAKKLAQKQGVWVEKVILIEED